MKVSANISFLYNGKELQSQLGLQWLDYGARMYDAQVGRWWSVDPLIEKHYDYTAYAYVYNNPIKLIDPFGLDSIKGKIDENGNIVQAESVLLGEIDVIAPNIDNEDFDQNGGVTIIGMSSWEPREKAKHNDNPIDLGPLYPGLYKEVSNLLGIFQILQEAFEGFFEDDEPNKTKEELIPFIDSVASGYEVDNDGIKHFRFLDKKGDTISMVKPDYKGQKYKVAKKWYQK